MKSTTKKKAFHSNFFIIISPHSVSFVLAVEVVGCALIISGVRISCISKIRWVRCFKTFSVSWVRCRFKVMSKFVFPSSRFYYGNSEKKDSDSFVKIGFTRLHTWCCILSSSKTMYIAYYVCVDFCRHPLITIVLLAFRLVSMTIFSRWILYSSLITYWSEVVI